MLVLHAIIAAIVIGMFFATFTIPPRRRRTGELVDGTINWARARASLQKR